jgi:hypothetical protein
MIEERPAGRRNRLRKRRASATFRPSCQLLNQTRRGTRRPDAAPGFLETLAEFPPNTFENRFSILATRLNLAATLDETEMTCLFWAAFVACLCNISFNGLGGCNGQIKPEGERNRIALEQEFSARRQRVLKSPGWKALPTPTRKEAAHIFLSVSVFRPNLAAEP